MLNLDLLVLKMPKSNETVVFLDFDGVLVTHRSQYGMGDVGDLWGCFDPVAIGLLNKLNSKHNLVFVVSSTWRRLLPDKKAISILKENGFKGNFHKDWCTPVTFSERLRAYEIEDWLEDHPEYFDNFIVIDDDETVDKHYPENSIVVDSYEGFLYGDYAKFVRKINGNEKQAR